MKANILFTFFLVALLIVGFNSTAYLQEKGYPNKPIQILLPYSPGTGIDTFNRLVAEKLRKDWKVPVNIINKIGAGGAIAAEEVAHARKDGYTLLSVYASTLATMTAANPEGPINLLRDFTPIIVNWANTGCVLVVRSDSEFKSLQDVVDYAKKNPNKLICSTAMVGTDCNLEFVLFKHQAKTDIIHVSYSTMAENITSLLGGHSHLASFSEASAKPHIDAGKVRGLATDIKTPSFPNVPTYIERGYDQVDLVPFILILGPKELPQEIIETWEKPLKELSKNQEFISTCNKAGVHVDIRMGAENLNTLVKEAVRKFSRFTPEELGWAKQKK
jgi:tripartite-type tricarboxylate transporter receptor subunit TctC